MKVGFDYWNTLTVYTNELGTLKSCLAIGGIECHVITAIGPTRIGTVLQEIHTLGEAWYQFPAERLHEVVFKHPRESPMLKLAKCQELGIKMFFDDRADVCELLNANGVLAFQVPRINRAQSDTEAERQ